MYIDSSITCISDTWNLEHKTNLRNKIVSSKYARISFWVRSFLLALAKVVEQEKAGILESEDIKLLLESSKLY